jgi:hypothetical protein
MKARRLILMASPLLTPAWPAATDERRAREHHFAMEILDYRIGSRGPSESKPPVPAKYDKYLGE